MTRSPDTVSPPGQSAGSGAGESATSPPSLQGLVVALDAMGGDNAPDVVIEGAAIARRRFPGVSFLIFGDEERVRALLDKQRDLAAVSEIRHTVEVVTNDVRPSVALRTGRQSSMRLAINAVSSGEASCIVSAGNTGALMAMAKFVLKTLPGIDRPAIAATLPTLRGDTVLLDLGANIDCRAEHLVQFAIMGSLFAKAVLGVREPTVGVLNVGAEALKGSDAVRDAAAKLRELTLPGSFYGFVEGNDITAGAVDVVVTDGFTGNVALKTAEGTAKLYAEWLRRTIQSSWTARLGYLLARNAFTKLKTRTDPRRYNGALFLGLRGICVKSHGGTDATGFSNAIGVGIDLVQNGFNAQVIEEFQDFVLPSTQAARDDADDAPNADDSADAVVG